MQTFVIPPKVEPGAPKWVNQWASLSTRPGMVGSKDELATPTEDRDGSKTPEPGDFDIDADRRTPTNMQQAAPKDLHRNDSLETKTYLKDTEDVMAAMMQRIGVRETEEILTRLSDSEVTKRRKRHSREDSDNDSLTGPVSKGITRKATPNVTPAPKQQQYNTSIEKAMEHLRVTEHDGAVSDSFVSDRLSDHSELKEKPTTKSSLKTNRAFALRRARLGSTEAVDLAVSSTSQRPTSAGSTRSTSSKKGETKSSKVKPATPAAAASASSNPFQRNDGGRFSLRASHLSRPTTASDSRHKAAAQTKQVSILHI